MRSIKLATIATILCIIIAYPLAYILSRKQGFQKQTLFVMVMLPMWMNFLLRTFAWMTILENNGLINKFLGLFGIGPLQMINTQGAVILGMVYNYIPFMILRCTPPCARLATMSSRRHRTWAATPSR